MREKTTQPLQTISHPTLWQDMAEEITAQISGGREAIGETPAVDGFGRPVPSRLVISLVLLFANPFA
ncbi:hypothetical protein ACN4EK_00445 [Pantanalinema rosaneae CENA516]|uniref:hypothetical protein n=1 Tax=Pantanalinema rosaneae TaxID=1620701 RepID=UPI003D6FE458